MKKAANDKADEILYDASKPKRHSWYDTLTHDQQLLVDAVVYKIVSGYSAPLDRVSFELKRVLCLQTSIRGITRKLKELIENAEETNS